MNTNELTNLLHQGGEAAAKTLIGEYGWLFAAAFVALMAKDLLMNMVSGLIVFIGNEWKNDEILYLSGRKARVIRKGLLLTTFQMQDRESSMSIPNSQLKTLTVERKLPNGHADIYLPTGGEMQGPMEVKILETDKPKPVAKKKAATRRKR